MNRCALFLSVFMVALFWAIGLCAADLALYLEGGDTGKVFRFLFFILQRPSGLFLFVLLNLFVGFIFYAAGLPMRCPVAPTVPDFDLIKKLSEK